MNAASITPPIAVRAFQQAELLRLLESGEAFPTKQAMAEALGRDHANMNKSLKALEADGLVEGLSVTDLGRRALLALDVAEGRAEVGDGETAGTGILQLTHDQLIPNALNPRKNFDGIEELAESIIGAGGLLVPLIVFPPRPDGKRMLAAGERRYRAIGKLIARGDWMRYQTMPCIEREEDPAQTALIALIENGQREGLNLYDEAVAYTQLMAALNCSAREAARLTGKAARTVQEAVQVVRDASPEDVALYRQGLRSWEWLRGEVREPAKPPPRLPSADDTQMDIEDFAPRPVQPAPAVPQTAPNSGRTLAEEMAVRQNSLDRTNAKLREQSAARENDREQAMRALSADFPDDEAGLLQIAERAVDRFDSAVCDGNPEEATHQTKVYDAVIWKLNGNTFFSCRANDDSPGARVDRHCAAEPGKVPLWGQAGEFLLVADDVRSVVKVKGGLHAPAIEFHVVDLDKPYISETGYYSHYPELAFGKTVAEAAPLWLACVRWDYQKKRQNKLVMVERGWGGQAHGRHEHLRDQIAARTWLATVAPVVVPPPLPSSSAAHELTAAEALLLLEIYDWTQRQAEAMRWNGAPCRADFDREVCGRLQLLALLSFGGHTAGKGIWHMKVEPAGLAALRERFSDLDQAGKRSKARGALHEALGVSAPPGGNGYATPWLNGPFEPDPSWLAKQEQIENDRKTQAALAEAAAELCRAAEARWRYLKLKIRAVDIAEAQIELRAYLQQSGLRAPWSAIGENLLSADEDDLTYGPSCGRAAEIAAMCVNLIAGIAPCDWPQHPSDDDALGHAEYLEEIARAIYKNCENGEPDVPMTIERARELAKADLAARLDRNGIAYGDPNYGWTAEDAENDAGEILTQLECGDLEGAEEAA